jgi:type IV secretory pathway VirD2 relaxase
MLRIVQMSKRGQRPRTTEAGTPSIRAYRDFKQWVAVRVSYAANKSPGQWKAHGRYVARESATQEGRAAEAGFNRIQDRINIAATLDNWQKAGDERLFKIIVSPELGHRLNLREYACEFIRRMEQDLGTQLQWVGAVHHNTEHPHMHLAND